MLCFSLKTSKKIKVDVVLGQTLGQIRSNVMNKSKETGITIRSFQILLWEYLVKQKLVVVKPPEWKFRQLQLEMSTLKAIRARFLTDFRQKLKKVDCFQ